MYFCRSMPTWLSVLPLLLSTHANALPTLHCMRVLFVAMFPSPVVWVCALILFHYCALCSPPIPLPPSPDLCSLCTVVRAIGGTSGGVQRCPGSEYTSNVRGQGTCLYIHVYTCRLSSFLPSPSSPPVSSPPLSPLFPSLPLCSQSSTSTIVQRLRQRATDYIRLLKKVLLLGMQTSAGSEIDWSIHGSPSQFLVACSY